MPSLESAAVLVNLALTFANGPLPKKSAHYSFVPSSRHSSEQSCLACGACSFGPETAF
jgi:hypothetical protein